MTDNPLSGSAKALYMVAMVNVALWALAMVALAILLHKGGNLRGMFVILAGGSGAGINLIALIHRRRRT